MTHAQMIARDWMPRVIDMVQATSLRETMRINRKINRTSLDPRKQIIMREIRLATVRHFRGPNGWRIAR